MYRSSAKRLSALFVSVVAVLFFGSSSALFGANKVEKKTVGSNSIKAYFPTKVTVSTPLRDHLKRPGPAGPSLKEGPDKPPRLSHAPANVERPRDPAVKTTTHPPNMPDPLADFEGIAQFESGCGCLPPDTNAAVGPDHVYEIVNSSFEIYDKTGVSQTGGPVAIDALWAGFGGPCETESDGDPIVKYDQLSQRWLVSEFTAFSPQSLQCFAVSTTSDPLGSYFLSSYDFGAVLNDYPKISIMPDAYYLTVRQFNAGTGSAVVAFDRAAMVAGDPATAIYFNINDVFTSDTFLAADMQGTNPPAAGSPESIIGLGNPDYDGSPTSVLHFIQMTPNFTDPPSTVITSQDVPVDPWVTPTGGAPQPEGSPALEVLPFPMYTPNYRNFTDHDALVFTHDVDAGGGQIGRRWYEIRSPLSATPVIYQQGTFAPDDGVSRWMGSAALDFVGNIAMGYSASSTTQFPSIWYTGRLPGDPLGEMSQGEGTIIEGTGSQQFSNPRWGDYSSMVTDPSDECTFWYTQEYIQTTGQAPWQTRMGSFKFPNCSIGPTGTIQGTVTDGTNPIEGAKVTAGTASTTTNAAGAYTITLPVGAYDMTASKYGFLQGSANGVAVTADGTTVQDFVLTAAPSTLVNGTVKDGSGAGWPLAANIKITGTGAPTFNITTDPATGYYEITLVEGIVYTFKITTPVPGYLPGGGPLDLTATARISASLVKNWLLFADPATCNAPGYTQSFQGLSEDFSSGEIPEGWTVINNSSGGSGGFPLEWVVVEGGAPCGDYSGNLTGGDGPFAVANSDCPGPTTVMDTTLITSSVNMTGFPAATLRFNEDYNNLGDNADVDVSNDGGSTWTNVLAQSSSARGPKVVNLDITSIAAGHSNVQARFHNYNAFWAWWWQVDNVLLGQLDCLPGTGGLVTGNVTSLATGAGLNGADVTNTGGGATTKTFAGNGDGFYAMFAPAGNDSFEASLKLYGPVDKSALVVPNGATVLNFALPSGKLTADPTAYNIRVAPNGTLDQTLVLTNSGSVAAAFSLRELNVPYVPPARPTGPFVTASQVRQAMGRLPLNYQKQVKLGKVFSLAKFGRIPGATDVPSVPTTAGDVIANYPASFATPNGLPFGVLIDNGSGNFYVSDLGSGFPGDNMDHEFTSDGTETGATIDMSSLGFLPVDGTFNGQTGMLWQATNDFFGGTNTCIYEIDPATKAMTGNTICPAFPVPQTGLAYDVTTDTYYSGSFFDNSIQHFNADGEILDSSSVGLAITGLAYNAGTGHLFAFQQTGAGAGNDDVYILDPANGYAVLGSFLVGAPGINPAASGGMEMDCDGHLVLVDQLGVNPIFVVDSGETNGSCHFVDTIPWVSEDPTDGTVPGLTGAGGNSNTASIAVHFDSTGLLPGLRQAQFTFSTDTPNKVPAMPLSLTVQFLDVPDDNQFQSFIYGAAGAGVMIGGPPNCPGGVFYFCPAGIVTRADMAGYIFRGVHGASTPPPVYQNIFLDVTFNQYNSFYIQGVYDDGIAAGCSSSPALYCPNVPVTRAQMSALIWKGMFGSQPPPAVHPGVFADVPCPSLFADYIEGLYNLGITAGCGNGNFCPNQPIQNGQMATFLVKSFNLPYLP